MQTPNISIDDVFNFGENRLIDFIAKRQSLRVFMLPKWTGGQDEMDMYTPRRQSRSNYRTVIFIIGRGYLISGCWLREVMVVVVVVVVVGGGDNILHRALRTRLTIQ